MDDLPVEKPRKLTYFLDQHDAVDLDSLPSPGPTIKGFRSCHPSQDSEMFQWMENHRILTKVW